MIKAFSRTFHILVIALALLASGRAQAQAADAAAFIAGLADEAVPVLTNPQVPEQQREQKFRELLDKGFDMTELSRLVLGRYWRQATPEEQSEFQGLLESYLVQLYADRFWEYQNVALEVNGQRSAQGSEAQSDGKGEGV